MVEWFQNEGNHYTFGKLFLFAKNVLILQRQSSKPPRSRCCESLVGTTKTAYYETGNKLQQEHHE